MAEQKEKVFINGIFIREYKFENGGSVLNVSCRVQDVIEELKKYEKPSGYVNLKIQEKRNPEEGGTTHYVELDTFEPKPVTNDSPPEKDIKEDDGLPF